MLDLGSEVNAKTLADASKLSLTVCHTNVKAQKINDFTLEIFRMVLASFEVEDKLKKVWFFQKTFLLTDISIKVLLEVPYLTLSNANVSFSDQELILRSYTATKTLFITK